MVTPYEAHLTYCRRRPRTLTTQETLRILVALYRARRQAAERLFDSCQRLDGFQNYSNLDGSQDYSKTSGLWCHEQCAMDLCEHPAVPLNSPEPRRS